MARVLFSLGLFYFSGIPTLWESGTSYEARCFFCALTVARVGRFSRVSHFPKREKTTPVMQAIVFPIRFLRLCMCQNRISIRLTQHSPANPASYVGREYCEILQRVFAKKETGLQLYWNWICKKFMNEGMLTALPSVNNLSYLQPCFLARSSNQGSVDGLRRDWVLQRLATFDSLSVQMRLEERSRMESRTIVCYLGGIWRGLEPLERIYGSFPLGDLSGRFGGVSLLGKPYISRENRLQYNP